MACRITQVRADFDQTLAANGVTSTLTGGGTANITTGQLILATSAAVTASADAATDRSVRYFPGREVYVQFTAAFTTPTSAASSQRAGLFDANNGFFLGYEGLGFGLTSRSATVDTHVARASFNGDLLDGGDSSDFTRDGVPEAIDLSLVNVWRIRYGWLGAGPMLLEVMAPDGHWVLVHAIRQPNSSIVQLIKSPHLPLRMTVTKATSDATDLQIRTSSWDAGVVAAPTGFTPCEVHGNVYKTAQVSGQILDGDVYTVTAGRALRVSSMLVSASNVAAVFGRLDIKDGVGGAILFSLLMDASPPVAETSIALVFPTPLRVAAGLYADIVSGTLTYSVQFVGYETSPL